MARKSGISTPSSKTILCIDDQTDFLEAISSLLSRQGHRVLTASDGSTGLAMLRTEHVDLLLLDYFMPGMTAEDVLAHVWNPSLQVILLTGYSSEKPPREMLSKLNIQGYCDKSRGPDELLLWVDVGLRSAATVAALDASRNALRQLLSTTARPTERRPLEDILNAIVSQATSMLGLRRVVVALLDLPSPFVSPSSFEESEPPQQGFEKLRIAASLGAPDTIGRPLEEVLPEEVVEFLRTGETFDEERFDDGILVGLRVDDLFEGVLWAEPPPASGSESLDLLHFVANQASALVRRHSAATLDLVTGLQSMSFWKPMAHRDLRSSFRFKHPVSLTTIGLLRPESVPDQGWDPVLEAVGRLVRLSIRGTDLAMRESDAQITILLPHTDGEGARRFGELITSRIADLEIQTQTGMIQIGAVASSVTLDPATIPSTWSRAPVPFGYFERAETLLRERAASLLGTAARQGAEPSLLHPGTEWPED
jgi:CheY-like chemotaxis protein/GGDEF domain-containing protein